MTQSSFFRAFASKEALLLELVRRMFGGQFALAEQHSGIEDPVLLYAVETSLQLHIAELTEPLRELYVVGYSLPTTSAYIYQSMVGRLQSIFGKYMPDLELKDFYEMEIASASIMRGFMAMPCDVYFTMEAKISRFLECSLKLYDVPQEQRKGVIAAVLQMDLRRMAEETKTREADCFYNHLKKPGLSIIGEFKKASPSLGTITSKIDLMERISEYNASVDAISCLTEEDHFHGNVAYLKEIRAKSSLPILRKDFMICEYQFYEAKVIGADAVLLITAILDDAQMHDFYQLAGELELDVLVETHDEAEVERAMKINPRIIGVNNRNLKDFTISLEHTRRLRPYVPEDKVFVAESGITGDEDVRFLRDCGVDAFLIGRAFMESENPKALAQKWKELYQA